MTNEKYKFDEKINHIVEDLFNLKWDAKNPKRILKLEKIVGQLDSTFNSNLFQDFEDKDFLPQIPETRMRGYRLSLWTGKNSENQIAWKYNENLLQTDSFYRSNVLYDSLAVDSGEGKIPVFENNFGIAEINSKPSFYDKKFNDALGKLKGISEDKARKVINAYKAKRKELLERKFSQFEDKEIIFKNLTKVNSYRKINLK